MSGSNKTPQERNPFASIPEGSKISIETESRSDVIKSVAGIVISGLIITIVAITCVLVLFISDSDDDKAKAFQILSILLGGALGFLFGKKS